MTAFLESHSVEQVPINYFTLAPTYYNISQEEKVESQKDIQKEIKLDNSFCEAPELFSEVRVEPNFMDEERYPVNVQIVKIVLETLKAMGVKDLDEFVTEWLSHCIYGIANFWEACQEYNQKYHLGNNQIVTYLNLLNDKFYCVTTL